MSSELVEKINRLGSNFADLMASIFLDGGATRAERDRFKLRLARHCAMEPHGLAAEYLDHFLKGSGSPRLFSTEQLLRDDPGVAERLHGEVYRRVHGIKTVRERVTDSRMSPAPWVLQDRKIITIFQHTYATRDWQLALGTFPFEWQVIGQSEEVYRVRVWGENTYTWHPDSRRITRFLHQAGSRLSTLGEARDFKIAATSHVLSIAKGGTEWLRKTTLTQANPKHGKLPLR